MQGKTTLVIAHRLSTIRNADQIVVLGNGGIAELGNHDALMAQRGIYWHLNKVQSQDPTLVIGKTGEANESATTHIRS